MKDGESRQLISFNLRSSTLISCSNPSSTERKHETDFTLFQFADSSVRSMHNLIQDTKIHSSV